MLNVSDDALIQAEDLAEALACSGRAAKDFVRQAGGVRVCGKWVILGHVLKSHLTGSRPPEPANLPPSPTTARQTPLGKMAHIERRSL